MKRFITALAFSLAGIAGATACAPERPTHNAYVFSVYRREAMRSPFAARMNDYWKTYAGRPESADPDVQYADDHEFDTLYPDPEVTFSTSMADIPLAIQEMIFGNAIDDNGVLVRTSTDKPPYFAVGFKSEKSDGAFRYVWLYKVRAKPMTESYKTKEGKTITRQNGSVEWTAIKRTHDGRYQAVADEGQNGFDATKASTFLETVYEPAFTGDGP